MQRLIDIIRTASDALADVEELKNSLDIYKSRCETAEERLKKTQEELAEARGSSLIAKHEKPLIDKAELYKKIEDMKCVNTSSFSNGYNTAIRDVLKLL